MTRPRPALLFADLDRWCDPAPGIFANRRPWLRRPAGELVIKGYLVDPADVSNPETPLVPPV